MSFSPNNLVSSIEIVSVQQFDDDMQTTIVNMSRGRVNIQVCVQ